MDKDTQSRKWQITINNPIDKGYTHDRIKEQLFKFKSLLYFCMSDEIGENQTYHTHIYMQASSGVRFSTIKKRFDGGHFEMAQGTPQQNRDYVFKEGKWKGTAKEETNLPDTHEEYGELPLERQGARNDLADLYDMIKSGMSTFEILENAPQYITQFERIDKIRQTLLEERYKNEWRNLEVTYIWGLTGSGKTRSVMEKYGYPNVYRVTDYDHPFDSYKGQDVVVFEEFRSSLRIDDMLKYLDGYPVELPARYFNKTVCFHKVFIITNIDIRNQYKNVQEEQPTTWHAFLRRIHSVQVFTGSEVVEYPTFQYLKEYFPIFSNPFDNPEEWVAVQPSFEF